MPTYHQRSDADYGAGHLPGWLRKQLRADGLEGGRMPLFVLGEDESWELPAAFVLEMPPNYELFRHAHPTHRVEVIVRGSLRIEGGRVLRPGDVMTARPFEMYGPHTAGPEGCTTMEIFSALEGMFRVISDTPDGPVEVDVRTGQLPVGMAPLG